MNNMFDLADEIISLAKTIEEGLNHLHKRMGELHFEDTRYLFEDVVEGYKSILVVLENREDRTADMNGILQKSDILQQAFTKMNQSYEEKKLNEARMDMQFILLPAFQEWLKELEIYLRITN